MKSDMMVAETIRDQIGSRALYMLGAHTLVGDTNSLKFHIRGSRACNVIVIKLDPSDTYTVTFAKSRGMSWKVVKEVSDVYVDSLHRLIETTTGLYTSL